MKKSDIIFWAALGIIAFFLYYKGNDVHKEYYDHIREKVQTQHNVIPKEGQVKE
jgi:hypothetical protein